MEATVPNVRFALFQSKRERGERGEGMGERRGDGGERRGRGGEGESGEKKILLL